MPRVSFTPNLERHIQCPACEAAGETVRAVLDAAFQSNPAARGYVLDEHGELRKHVVVFVNGTPVSDRRELSDRVAPADEVYVFQALSGG